MPTESHFFQCDICRDKFDTLEEAQECEDQGLMEIPEPGIIFGDNRRDSFYKDVLFVTTDQMDKSWQDRHIMEDGWWAFRDNGAGDNTGETLCGSGLFEGWCENHFHAGRNMPAFRRAVEYLKSRGITPQVMTENGPVPVE